MSLKSVAALVIAVIIASVGGFLGGQAAVAPQTITQTTSLTFTTTMPTTILKTETVTITETPTLPETMTVTLPPITTTTTATSTVTKTVTTIPTLGRTVKVGESAFGLSGKIFEVAVLDFVRGEPANKEIRRASLINPAPKEGYEYLLVKAQVTYLEGKESASISRLNFKAYVEGAGLSPKLIIAFPEDKPEFPAIDLMPGGGAEGWIIYEVPQGKEVLIAFEYGFEPLCFISLGK